MPPSAPGIPIDTEGFFSILWNSTNSLSASRSFSSFVIVVSCVAAAKDALRPVIGLIGVVEEVEGAGLGTVMEGLGLVVGWEEVGLEGEGLGAEEEEEEGGEGSGREEKPLAKRKPAAFP